MPRVLTIAIRLGFLSALIGVMGGCGAFRLPAIDPTGERIFLPDPSYTTLVSPLDSRQFYSCLPEPAFREPPPIPPCPGMPGGVPPGSPPGTVPGVQPSAPQQARLLLTPAKIVAPIHSEVVLLAGICGPDGHYICKQPIEWMLSPDSVGNIHALAQSSHPSLAKITSHSARKECSTLAITRTTTAAQRITRGTPQTTDDVAVGKGQTWISVSSPTEGISHVTALARGEDNWDFRRQTAIIHWVDLQWAFPGPQIHPAGQVALLSTAVSRMSTGRSAGGVIVRYDVIEGNQATFFGEGRTSVELETNQNGRADVQLQQTQPGPATAKIRIQILAGALRDSGSDRPVIGEGFTTVTWSAPGLQVRIAGPEVVAAGAPVLYQVEVANPGDVPANGVKLAVKTQSANGRRLLNYLNSQPSGTRLGYDLLWEWPTIGPRQAVRIDVQFTAVEAGTVQVDALASTTDPLEANASAITRIVDAGLTVRFVDPPETAKLGVPVGFNFEVQNTGGTELRNVVVRDYFDAGLQPNYQGQTSPVQLDPFNLAPGQSVQKAIVFVPQAAGQLCHTLQVAAEGGLEATAKACVVVAQPTLAVQVRKIGPPRARVGDQATFTIVVTNSGEGPLTNLRVADVPGPGLEPTQGSPGWQRVDNAIVWNLPSLAPGATTELRIVCACREAQAATRNVVEVTADQGLREVAESGLVIEAPQAPPVATPPANDQRPAANAAGRLEVNLVLLENVVPVGKVGRLLVSIRNTGNQDDGQVWITVRLPSELKYVRHTWTSPLSLNSRPAETGVAIVGPINTLGAGQQDLAPIYFELEGVKPGKVDLRVEVTSQLNTTPVEKTISVQVSAG